jgi:hypothetical protein
MKLPLLLAFALLGFSLAASAKTCYVDAAANGAHDGTSWINAWTNFDQVSGLLPGDIVYISGGPTGSSKSYTFNSISGYPGIWLPVGGVPGNPITYKIGQEAGHNGIARFVGYGAQTGGGYWLGYQTNPRPHDFVISGDAGDGQMHFELTNYAIIGVGMGYANVRISYINFGQIGNGIDFLPATGLEFDHNYVYILNPAADHFSSASINESTWGQSSIHDCKIFVPGAGTGFGADCLQWNGAGGFDIYNNYISGYTTNYVGGQHMDGWQGQGGSKIRIYGNTFVRIANYAIYGDDTSGGFTELQIYNNVIIKCGGGIIVGVDGGAPTNNTFTNVLLANNVVDNGTTASGQSFALNNVANNHSASFVNCLVANNCIIGGGNYDFANNSTTTTSANVQLTTAQAAAVFVSYTPDSIANDYHPLSTASVLLGAGTNLYSYFTTDKDGAPRPAVGKWDIGAYVGPSGPKRPKNLRVGPSGASPIAFVQSKAGGNSFGGGSTVATFDSNVAAGNLLVVSIVWSESSGTQTVSGVTDSLGNTYALIPGSYKTVVGHNTSQIACQHAYCISGAAGANTVTATFSGGAFAIISILEATPGTYDQSTTGTGTSTTHSAGSLTTPSNGCLAVAATMIDDGSGIGGGFTKGAGWTSLILSSGGGVADWASEYFTQSTAGSVAGNFTAPGSGIWVASMVTFKP